MKLHQKLLLGLALVALVVGCVGYVAQTMNARVEYGVLRLSDGVVPQVEHATAMDVALRESQGAALDLARTDGAAPPADTTRADVTRTLGEALAAFESHLDAARAATSRARAHAELSGHGADAATALARLGGLAALGRDFERYRDAAQRLPGLAPAAARAFYVRTVEPLARERLRPAVTRYRSSASQLFDAETEAVRAQLEQADRMLFVAVLLAIGMTLVLGILIAHSIARPLLSLTEATRIVGSGRLDVRLPVHARDEIGALAEAFNAMTEELSQTTVSKRYLDTLIHSMADPLFVVSADGIVELANEAAAAALGVPAGDLVGRPFASVLRGAAAEVWALLDEVALSGYAVHPETALRQSDGGRLPVSLSAAAMHEGEAQGVVCVAKDLTPQKRVEAALIRARDEAEAAARLKSNFLANMSHEVRTPLTGIIGSAQVLTGALDGEPREVVSIIERSAVRLLGTINSVLDMARLEAGGLHPHAEPVRLADEAEDALGILRSLAEGKGLTLTLDERVPDLWALADPTCFHRICTNLIGNAIKFTREGGVTVELDAELDAEGERALLRVRDTGVGINTAFLPHLFDEFQQESTGHGRSHEGTGLGLAITKRLAELMDGSVEVETAKGQGTTFTVRLPRTVAPGATRHRCRTGAAGRQG